MAFEDVAGPSRAFQACRDGDAGAGASEEPMEQENARNIVDLAGVVGEPRPRSRIRTMDELEALK